MNPTKSTFLFSFFFSSPLFFFLRKKAKFGFLLELFLLLLFVVFAVGVHCAQAVYLCHWSYFVCIVASGSRQVQAPYKYYFTLHCIVVVFCWVLLLLLLFACVCVSLLLFVFCLQLMGQLSAVVKAFVSLKKKKKSSRAQVRFHSCWSFASNDVFVMHTNTTDSPHPPPTTPHPPQLHMSTFVREGPPPPPQPQAGYVHFYTRRDNYFWWCTPRRSFGHVLSVCLSVSVSLCLCLSQ